MTKKNDHERISLADLPELMTPEQLAAATGKHPNAIRRQCADGTIPAQKIGNQWRIGRDNVLGPIMPRPIVIDERGMEKLLDEVKKLLEAGKPLTLEVRSEGCS